jgi:hypothetical protein
MPFNNTPALNEILYAGHQALDNRDSLMTMFVDYSQTFDPVDHVTIPSKMAALGVQPP